MQRIASLAKAPINLAAIREAGRRELEDILSQYPGPKCVVLDERLARPLNLITDGADIFKSNGVVQLCELQSNAQASTPTVLYLVRPDVKAVQQIAQQIEADGRRRKYAVYFVPRQTVICASFLKEKGLSGVVQVGEYRVDLIPLDDDLVTMALSGSFKECMLQGDLTSLSFVANALHRLQVMFGPIARVHSKGSMSQIVLDMMHRLRTESPLRAMGTPPAIDTLVLIDRHTDLYTPLMLPLTYEALIDEILFIDNGCVNVTKYMVTGEEADKGTPDKILVNLNSNDELYADVRNFNISVLPQHLQEKSRQIQAQYEARPRDSSQSVSQLREFVKQIPRLKEAFLQLTMHINLTERITAVTNNKQFRDLWNLERGILVGESAMDRIFDMIPRQTKVQTVLRLACLQSLVDNGLKPKVFDLLRREIIQTYGFEYLLTLHNLERIGLLRRREASGHWATVCSKLDLINDEVNVSPDTDDLAYVTSGYAPLSCRVVQLALTRAWASKMDVLRLLPGPICQAEHDDSAAAGAGGAAAAAPSAGPASSAPGLGAGGADRAAAGAAASTAGAVPSERKVALVFFVGGVTFMEVAALRAMCRSADFPFDVVVASTNMINGDSFLEGISDELPSAAAAAAPRSPPRSER